MSTAPRLTIDLSALADNWRHLSAISKAPETAAVVKADAYGLGIEHVVPVLAEAGCKTFFVAMAEEAVCAREASPDANIYVLNGIFEDTVETLCKHNLSPVLSTIEQLDLWIARGKNSSCAIHVDSGMNRLGLALEEAEKLSATPELVRKAGAKIIMSHLACADEPDHELNKIQLETFQKIASRFNGLHKSLANSAAALSNPSMHFDLVRPGIAMYGGEAVNDFENPMKPVVTAQARILQIRNVPRGETVGYGASARMERDSQVAICSAGYADGYHRSSSGSGVPLRHASEKAGYGFLCGQKVPVVGRVSMDLTAFDVTDIPPSKLSSSAWIELFGKNIPVDDAARACGTIGYELLTGLGNRYSRIYEG